MFFQELHLPITFLSGKIHKLQIHIPWTKLGSEPVEITISTLECVVQLKYPDHSPSDQSSKASEAASANSENEKEELEKVMEGKEEVPPSGYVQSLINRVINNSIPISSSKKISFFICRPSINVDIRFS